MTTSILPRLIHRTEYVTHLFLIYEFDFVSIMLLWQIDFALMGRVGNMNLGFISKLMRSLFEQSIRTNKISIWNLR